MPVDPRFFEPLCQPTLGQLAELTGAQFDGDASAVVTGLAAADAAKPGDICFHDGDAASAASVSSNAVACFVKSGIAGHLPEGVAGLEVKFPRLAHAMAGDMMFRARGWFEDDDGESPSIDPTTRLAPGVVIAAGVAIGKRTTIGPNTVIGPGVQIGRDCIIGANVSIQCALIGNSVKINSGSRIGETGFGVMSGPDGAEDAPQYGRVILQDFVSIGANTCVDRGAFDDTILGERTKVDNLCQIAHNVVTGRSVLMASFAGISGSVTIGDGAMLGGRVGIADHVKVGAGTLLAASAGVFRTVPDGETWGGTPAKPLRQWMRELAWVQKQVAPKSKAKS